jgi:hypothetical protein
MVFELGRDDPRVLHWLGLPVVPDGERQWLDLAARAAEGDGVPGRPSHGRYNHHPHTASGMVNSVTQ